MGLIDRLSTLAKADAHGVVDALEDRALLMRQYLREAAAELEHKRCRLQAIVLEDRELARRAERVTEQMTSLEEDVELALSSDKEDLGRFAIRRLLPLRRAAEELEGRRRTLEQERAETAARLAEQEREYGELETRVKAYLARCHRGEEDVLFADAACWAVGDEEVELELLRRRRVRQAEEEAT